MTFVKLIDHETSCPSQWDAWDADGTYYYIRYRWGRLTVAMGEVLGDLVFDAQVGGQWDGTMTTDEMLKITGATGP